MNATTDIKKIAKSKTILDNTCLYKNISKMNATTDIKNATTTTRSAAEEEQNPHISAEKWLATVEMIGWIDEYYAPKEDCGNCCLCKGLLSNKWGNNPAPLRKRGKCCDKCNADKVIPTRMGCIDGNARFGGKSILGTHEEQILEKKLFLLMWEEMWEQDYEPFNKIKREYRDLVFARGMFPHIDWRKKSISFTPIAEMVKDEWDKQNMTYEIAESNDPN